jgi:hypothetical protein
MQRLLRLACHAANLAHEKGKPIPASRIAVFERIYDRIISAGMAFRDVMHTLNQSPDTLLAMLQAA